MESRLWFHKTGVETLFIPRIAVFGERSNSRSASSAALFWENGPLLHGFVDFVFQQVKLAIEIVLHLRKFRISLRKNLRPSELSRRQLILAKETLGEERAHDKREHGALALGERTHE